MPEEPSSTPLVDSLWHTDGDRVLGRKQPEHLAAARYHGLRTGTAYDNLGYNLGSWLSNMRGSPMAKTVAKGFNHPASGFFAGAIPAMLLGVGGQALLNYLGNANQYRNPWLTGAFTGAAGGLIGGNVGHTRNHWMSKNSAAWRSGPADPYQEIFSALQRAEMSPMMKQEAMSAVSQLPPSDADQLARMVGGVFGAAVGAIIMRFLSGRGLIRAAIGAAGGGILGSLLAGSLGGRPSPMRGFAF